ncbi:DUF4124 domain-containing protein [Marinobacterium aestuariivivens]|uniref:DUF4124 domain-containing protein n=1 Tax=Marinobacterium aestuariivivens TaxID=1698799 RepID=A0ABW2A1K8_9GAMM
MKTAQILAGLVLAGFCTGALAEPVYRWTDEKGKQHFGDVPPEGVDAKAVTFSNMSVVSMPKVESVSAAESNLPPECEPSYRGDEPCPLVSRSGERSVESAGEPAGGETKADDAGAEAEPSPGDEPSNRLRRESLETRSEQIEDYDKSERIKEIEEDTEAAKKYERDEPKTLTEKLREKAGLDE